MDIDHSQFPLVWMHYRSTTSQGEPFSQLDRLLQRRQPFVLVTTDAPGAPPQKGEAEPAGLKQASLWMKQNKAAIRHWIKASIVITADPEAQARVVAFAETHQKFWGYPLLYCATTAAATVMVDRLLSTQTGSQNW